MVRFKRLSIGAHNNTLSIVSKQYMIKDYTTDTIHWDFTPPTIPVELPPF
jgi:hypothetical protein